MTFFATFSISVITVASTSDCPNFAIHDLVIAFNLPLIRSARTTLAFRVAISTANCKSGAVALPVVKIEPSFSGIFLYQSGTTETAASTFAVLYFIIAVSGNGVGSVAPQPARPNARIETLAINLVFII